MHQRVALKNQTGCSRAASHRKPGTLWRRRMSVQFIGTRNRRAQAVFARTKRTRLSVLPRFAGLISSSWITIANSRSTSTMSSKVLVESKPPASPSKESPAAEVAEVPPRTLATSASTLSLISRSMEKSYRTIRPHKSNSCHCVLTWTADFANLAAIRSSCLCSDCFYLEVFSSARRPVDS